MDMNKLLIDAHQLLDSATVDDGMGYTEQAIAALAQLRELLNKQPELEAGGSYRICRVCGCTDLNACPGPCYWVEDNLCSNCARPGTKGKTAGSTGAPKRR